MNLVIRTAQSADLPAVVAIDPFEGDRGQEIAEQKMLVAVVDEQVAGFITSSDPGFIYKPFIHFLAVSQRYRRLGIAKKLIHAGEQRYRGKRVFISTEEFNYPMLTLLQNENWIPAGKVEGINDNGIAECFFYKDIPA